MSIIPPGFVEARHEFAIPGDAGPAYLIVGYANEVSVSPIEPDALASYVHTALGTTILPILSSEVSLVATDVVVGQDGDPLVGRVVETWVGGGSASVASPQVAALVSKRTGLGGRRNRGRLYLPGVVETSVDGGGYLTGTFATDLATAVGNWLDETVDVEMPMVLLHGSAPSDPTPITSLVLSPKVATQRRRLR